MEIITYKNLKGNCLCGYIEIPKGTEFPTILHEDRECVCFPDKRLITLVYSKRYIEYFARNDDGNGLLRGPLAYLISHTNFTEEQLNILYNKWKIYIKTVSPFLLFKNLLYEAKIETLCDIVNSLNLKEV